MFSEFTFAPQNNMGEESKILDRCERLFMRYGIKSVTMDDVSRELGISKKTLYQYFENKEDLVYKVTQNHFECQNQEVSAIIANSGSAIDEMIGISDWMNKLSKNMNPGIVFDLRKYHPESWQVFIRHRNEYVFKCIFDNIERGKREGLYREDLNSDIIARIYISKMEMFFDPEIFPSDKYTPEKTFKEFMNYHIHGIATQKGIKYLEKLKTITI